MCMNYSVSNCFFFLFLKEYILCTHLVPEANVLHECTAALYRISDFMANDLAAWEAWVINVITYFHLLYVCRKLCLLTLQIISFPQGESEGHVSLLDEQNDFFLTF